MNRIWVADLQILGAAFFFGIGFIGQRAVSVEGLGPMTCNALRFFLSAVMLFGCLAWAPSKWLAAAAAGELLPPASSILSAEKVKSDEDTSPLLSAPAAASFVDLEIDDKDSRRDELKSSRITEIITVFPKILWPYLPLSLLTGSPRQQILFWGIFLGCLNFLGSGFQQWGITLTSANKVAFIAGFDLFLTPIFALCIPTFKRNGKPSLSTWIAVVLSFIGLYLLSDADIADFSMGKGEVLTLISTLFWTLHITYTDIATAYVDSLQMMAVQLSVVAILSTLVALSVEPQGWLWHHVALVLPYLLFLAIVEGIGFTFMALGQNFSPPTHAAILLSLEGVFTSIVSYFTLHEVLSGRETFGCVLMLLATALAKLGIPFLETSSDAFNLGLVCCSGSLRDATSGERDSAVGSSGAETEGRGFAQYVRQCATVPARLLLALRAHSLRLWDQLRSLLRRGGATASSSSTGTTINTGGHSNGAGSAAVALSPEKPKDRDRDRETTHHPLISRGDTSFRRDSVGGSMKI